MHSDFRENANQTAVSDSIGARDRLSRAGVIVRLIVATTIAGSLFQAIRSDCAPLAVIQFWMSLFIAAIVHGAAKNSQSAAAGVGSSRDDFLTF